MSEDNRKSMQSLTPEEVIEFLILGLKGLQFVNKHSIDIENGTSCRCLKAALDSLRRDDVKDYFRDNACEAMKTALTDIDLARDAAFAWNESEF